MCGGGTHTQRLEEPALSRKPSQRREANEGRGDSEKETRRYMAEAEMTEFMGEYRLDLVVLQGIGQSIEQDDALGVSEASEVGVAVGGSA